METLLDYIFETKRWSYIVAVILMIGAIPFWKFLIEREENEEQVNRFLDRHPEYQREQEDVFLFPPDAGTDGGYAARLRYVG